VHSVIFISVFSAFSSENVPQPFQVAGTSKRTHFDFAATWKGCGTLRAALFIVSGRRNATSMTLFFAVANLVDGGPKTNW
jgi:hypothetical protein